jgi:glycosyltransferase involved in cell wall biosynthesis
MTSNKKIAILVPSLANSGGAEKSAILLAKTLSDSGHNVLIISLSEKAPFYSLPQKIEYLSICSMTKSLIRKNVKRIKLVSSIIKTKKIDILIGYTSIGGIISASIKIFKNKKIKVIICERNAPYVDSCLMKKLKLFLYQRVDGGVFQTKQIRDFYQHSVPKSCIIPNILDDNILKENSSWEIKENKIICISRLEPEKNNILLIKAIDLIKDDVSGFQVDLFGSGSQKLFLEQEIMARGLEDIIYLKGVSRDIYKDLSHHKIFVLSSITEGYPNALLEAMSLGLGCISTRCFGGGAESLITNGENGLLVDNNDYVSLSKAIKYLIKNEDFTKMIGESAKKVKFSNSSYNISRKWESFIYECL